MKLLEVINQVLYQKYCFGNNLELTNYMVYWKMIPFIVKRADPQEYCDCEISFENINVKLCHAESIEKLDEAVSRIVAQLMCGFYVGEYIGDDKITSYADFCEKYWETFRPAIYDWHNPYRVYYFNNGWSEWNTLIYGDKIFKAFEECVARYEDGNNVDLTIDDCDSE